MGILDDIFKQIFGGSDSSSNASGANRTRSTMLSKAEIEASLKRKYKNIDGKGKLEGTLFTDLINKTNEAINDVNEKKQNTKL